SISNDARWLCTAKSVKIKGGSNYVSMQPLSDPEYVSDRYEYISRGLLLNSILHLSSTHSMKKYSFSQILWRFEGKSAFRLGQKVLVNCKESEYGSTNTGSSDNTGVSEDAVNDVFLASKYLRDGEVVFDSDMTQYYNDDYNTCTSPQRFETSVSVLNLISNQKPNNELNKNKGDSDRNVNKNSGEYLTFDYNSLE
ncbi:15181_t:CDS:2, partial [Funneliformis caledonium]